MWCIESQPVLWKNMSPPSSVLKRKPSKKSTLRNVFGCRKALISVAIVIQGEWIILRLASQKFVLPCLSTAGR
jgi:hypothetical protein